MFGFKCFNQNIDIDNKLQNNQIEKLKPFQEKPAYCENLSFCSLNDILDADIPDYKKPNIITYLPLKKRISMEEIYSYLRNYSDNKNDSNYKKMLCAYDFVKYGTQKYC